MSNLHRYVLRLLVVVAVCFTAMPAITEVQVYFNTSNHKVHKLSCHWEGAGLYPKMYRYSQK